MSVPSVDFMESIENRLWDMITEFHFLLRDIGAWDWDDVILQDKLRRLHDKLRGMVVEMVIECVKYTDAGGKQRGKTTDKLEEATRESKSH